MLRTCLGGQPGSELCSALWKPHRVSYSFAFLCFLVCVCVCVCVQECEKVKAAGGSRMQLPKLLVSSSSDNQKDLT
jgi:hypothetical protein